MKKIHSLFSAALLFAPARFAAADAPKSVAAGKPNLLFILTDDQRWNTLGCLFKPDEYAQTPAQLRAFAGLFLVGGLRHT